MRKKLIKMMLFFILVMSVILPSGHIHDNQCGYDQITEKGCIYEIELFDNKHPGG